MIFQLFLTFPERTYELRQHVIRGVFIGALSFPLQIQLPRLQQNKRLNGLVGMIHPSGKQIFPSLTSG